MITVSILINGKPIFTRSARNNTEKNKNGQTKYVTDAGCIIYHDPEDGAIELAKLMLDTINENMEIKNNFNPLPDDYQLDN